ncbi:hypothetical protein SAMN05192561_101451 [Halopenitus malekzadehii]|uniref:ABC transporter permease n=1 Tax=Halopenitus malekzadehii TaxID=1267564 RepID=A0A1H6HXZ4_9EURY|nr:hypothetical protein [Halopenitus malekzadehii]SEH39041.1 hypothetical protein SAMN05192561_101451 [Halopenitus malekzadehii]
MEIDTLSHPGFRALLGVGLGYGALLAIILLVLFLVPYALFVGL